jgi:SAM-dependent methyltransferase
MKDQTAGSETAQMMSVDPSSLGAALRQLAGLQQAPEPFTPGERLFWDHPHISSQMLAAHLDPDTDAASRRPETIDRSVAWLVDKLDLKAGDAVLDLGCGPGLYASRLARRGLHVTGIDYSQRSIDYARQHAQEHDLAITYRYQDYLTLDDEGAYDAALLIYGDYCVLAPERRSRLLQKIRQAVKAGGRLALDVSTRAHRARYGLGRNWYVAERGFWRPGRHLVLEQGFDYPERSIYLDQYVVVDADGTLAVYRNWFQDYTPRAITRELEEGGFAVLGIWGDLAGTPYAEGSEWIGVVAEAVYPIVGTED